MDVFEDTPEYRALSAAPLQLRTQPHFSYSQLLRSIGISVLPASRPLWMIGLLTTDTVVEEVDIQDERCRIDDRVAYEPKQWGEYIRARLVRTGLYSTTQCIRLLAALL